MAQGNGYTGYDLPASTRGFRFTANGREENAGMGGEIKAEGGVTLQIRLPIQTECRLLKDGQVIRTWKHNQNCAQIVTEAGIYRVEAFIPYYSRSRGWIFSNPIFVK